MDNNRKNYIASFANKENELDIYIYDEISAFYGISSKNIVNVLSENKKVEKINLHINSIGGDVFEGFAIYNLLKSHKASVTVDIEGVALSIASIVALCGDTIRMAGNSLFMIHNPYTFAEGDAKSLKETAKTLEYLENNLIGTYAKKTNLSRDKIADWMDAETWFTATEALDNGFVDEITNPIAISAKYVSKKLSFKNMPKNICDYIIDSDDFKKKIKEMEDFVNKYKNVNACKQ